MLKIIDKLFFKGREVNIMTEIEGGLATFFTMCYIIFVQPAILSKLGMDFGSVMVATCLSSAIATILMGILANYPIALAPGMGHNFLFVITASALAISWEKALGIIFISGSLFIILSLVPFRERILNDMPNSLKYGISVGIGLLITLIGLEWSGIVVQKPGTFIGLGELNFLPVLITFSGLLVIIFLHLRDVKSAILWGILSSTSLSLLAGLSKFHGVVSLPPSIEPTFFKFKLLDVLSFNYLAPIFVFLFLDVFDTVGTLVGVGEQGGFIHQGKLPRAKSAFLADAIGTLTGSVLGTSTVTSYIESASGISVGAKTGLASVITGLLFIIALFFYPLVQTVGGGYESNGFYYYPTISPALIFVGYLMTQNVKKIDFKDFEEGFPAFLAMIMIPLTFSITDGIAFGFISYSLIGLFRGKIKEQNRLVLTVSLIFILKYIFLK
ncbi:MAG: NCS2 family permease [Proteobacteria bacterium]|nr:NCS2 family permease [Pseudomonadota bacterium]